MAQKAPKVCYYELLGVDRKCEVAEIKASYRKLALKMHPDKAQVHGLSVEEATRKFQQIQEAYSVLSDPQERAWYDAHREQILRGDDEPGEDPFKTKVNLYKYFSTGCYNGFGDGAGGFFAAYSELFSAVDTEEAEWEDADEEHTPMPPFGNSRSEWADVSSFYRNWLEFCSRKAFGHADKWNPKEAQNRQVRRAMEQENKKARQAAKREFNAEVRQLVQFVQKRDPRVAAHQKEQMKAAAEKTQRAQLDKERLKAAEARQKQERKEAMRRADEERWAEAAAARARGELLSDDEPAVENEEVLEYRCEPCRKSFKSEKAFEQHARSKKHLQIIEQLRKELELELELEKEAQAAAEEQEESDEATTSEGSHEGASCPIARVEEAAEEAEEEEEEEDDEDNFVARFAAVKRPEKQDAGKEAEKEDRSSSEDEDEDENVNVTSGGKTAQKRAKQKAILMERKAEKEQAEARRQAEAEEEEAAAAAQRCEPADAASTAPSRPAIETTCAVCGEKFPSRSKLFQHIKATGHAALKPVPAAEATARGRRKKR